jgi:hypothetical protein
VSERAGDAFVSSAWPPRARAPGWPTLSGPGRRRLLLGGLGLLWLLAICSVVGGLAWLFWPHPTPLRVVSMPPRPAGWPDTLQLGLFSGPNEAAQMRATTSFGFRYQYLAGGVNTGNGWATWSPDGGFVTEYIRDSDQNGMTPVFTYYMLTQSAPGRGNGPSEPGAVQANVSNADTMRAYYLDLKLFFQRAGAAGGTPVILHIEPDLWGFLHQQGKTDDATRIPIVVGSSGLPELADLPDNLGGFARAIVRLRDQSAPNVILGYHVSAWGTGQDLFVNNALDAAVDDVARSEAAFYTSLGAGFDVAFAEFSDRDAAFKQYVYHDKGRSWWDADDFARHVRFLSQFVEQTGRRIVLWQIPLGNTRMRAMDNTWNHYQDTRVEWLLDDPARDHLRQYVGAGVIGLLFGRGADGATNAADSAGDGVTDPAPINGNDRPSLSADDDGGYFRERAAAYYREGPLALP